MLSFESDWRDWLHQWDATATTNDTHTDTSNVVDTENFSIVPPAIQLDAQTNIQPNIQPNIQMDSQLDVPWGGQSGAQPASWQASQQAGQQTGQQAG